MSTIDVLWYEDDPDVEFVKLAEDEDFKINLILYENAKSAIEYFKNNYEKLDGAILDVRNDKDVRKERGMYELKDTITSYSRLRPIPVAIITGHEDILRREGFEDTLNCKLFRKDRDKEAALEYIRDNSLKLEDVKIKNENYLAFEIFDEQVLKEVISEDKIQSLKGRLVNQLKDPVDIDSTREIIRDFFEGLIIPLLKHYDVIPKYHTEFNNQIRYSKIDEKKFGKEIKKLFDTIGFNSQSLKHDKSEIPIVNYLQCRKDKYFIECHFNGLLSILTWLPYFIKNN